MEKRASFYKTVFVTFVILSLLICSRIYSQQEEENKEIETGTVTDIDGNVYKTVKIGKQWWMAENLKVTHYRNGDTIPNVTDNKKWENLKSGAYCYYDNNISHAAIYGALYNWYAVNDSRGIAYRLQKIIESLTGYAVNDSRGIAPDGWHVPTSAEWDSLINELGGRSVAGGKMKETGTTLWYSPNEGASNESGFTALPGGMRLSGDYKWMNENARFWSSTPYDDVMYTKTKQRIEIHHAFTPSLSNISLQLTGWVLSKNEGHSVRCVRD